MFSPNLNAELVGIDKTKKFKVIDDKNNPCISNGDILELERDDGTPCPYFNNLTNGEKHILCYWHRLEYADKSFSKAGKSFSKGGLSVGDIIIDRSGDKAKVLEVGETSFSVSCWNNYKQHGAWLTYKEAIIRDWKIEGADIKEQEEMVDIKISKSTLNALKKQGIKISS